MKNNKCKNKKSLNIIAHSHGGNVVKQMSNLYDYTQEKTPVVINIATPNRKDYVMNPNIKEYYNVYNKYDTFVQGWAGGSDMPNNEGWLKIHKFSQLNSYQNDNYTFITNSSDRKNIDKNIVPLEELQKFHYTIPSQTAKEPNAVNVEIKQDYFTSYNFIKKIYNQGIMDGTKNTITGNHSDFKNPQTMQTLQKEMKKRRGNE